MKTKLSSLFLGLAILAGVHQTNAQVTNLGIAPAPGGQSLLYWPVNLTNYVLQTVTNLASTNWLTARTAFAVDAAEVTNAAPAGFFQLQPVTPPAGMALIPAGWFTMGDTRDGEGDASPTQIFVSAFVMDVNLVSYGVWTNVYAYATSHGYSFEHPGADGNGNTATNYPVTTVNWYDCVKWCNARSQQASLTPCYYMDTNLTQPCTNGVSSVTVYANWSANGYRLPTEAEWEKAARGGGLGRRFSWGDLIHTNQAQYLATAGFSGYDLGPTYVPSGPSPVGSFDVNGYGLYDMAGNVEEWCWDWYGTPYGQPSTVNPTGPPESPLGYRVMRGGNWMANADYARCAFRYDYLVRYADITIGFRCVRGL